MATAETEAARNDGRERTSRLTTGRMMARIIRPWVEDLFRSLLVLKNGLFLGAKGKQQKACLARDLWGF
jgi:hypothetical protein